MLLNFSFGLHKFESMRHFGEISDYELLWKLTGVGLTVTVYAMPAAARIAHVAGFEMQIGLCDRSAIPVVFELGLIAINSGLRGVMPMGMSGVMERLSLANLVGSLRYD